MLPPEATSGPSAGLPDPARRPRGSFVSAAASRDASSSADEPAADAHRLTPVWCRDADGRTVVVPRAQPGALRDHETSLIPLTDDWFVLGLRFEVDAEVRQIFNHQGFHALAQRHIRCFVVPARDDHAARVLVTTATANLAPAVERVPIFDAAEPPALDLLRAHVEGPVAPPFPSTVESAESAEAAESSAAPSGSSSSRARCASGLFPHQTRTVRWMSAVERGSADVDAYDDDVYDAAANPVVFAGRAMYPTGLEHRLGEDPSKGDAAGGRRGGRHETARAIGAALAEAVGGGVGDAVAAATAAAKADPPPPLPRGGLLAHPVGAGKTVIVAAYLARDHAEREGEGEDDDDDDDDDDNDDDRDRVRSRSPSGWSATTLVLCPRQVAGQWLSALREWAPNLRCRRVDARDVDEEREGASATRSSAESASATRSSAESASATRSSAESASATRSSAEALPRRVRPRKRFRDAFVRGKRFRASEPGELSRLVASSRRRVGRARRGVRGRPRADRPRLARPGRLRRRRNVRVLVASTPPVDVSRARGSDPDAMAPGGVRRASGIEPRASSRGAVRRGRVVDGGVFDEASMGSDGDAGDGRRAEGRGVVTSRRASLPRGVSSRAREVDDASMSSRSAGRVCTDAGVDSRRGARDADVARSVHRAVIRRSVRRHVRGRRQDVRRIRRAEGRFFFGRGGLGRFGRGGLGRLRPANRLVVRECGGVGVASRGGARDEARGARDPKRRVGGGGARDGAPPQADAVAAAGGYNPFEQLDDVMTAEALLDDADGDDWDGGGGAFDLDALRERIGESARARAREIAAKEFAERAFAAKAFAEREFADDTTSDTTSATPTADASVARLVASLEGSGMDPLRALRAALDDTNARVDAARRNASFVRAAAAQLRHPDAECSVCLERLAGKDVTVLRCLHVFDARCVAKLLVARSVGGGRGGGRRAGSARVVTCPLCRADTRRANMCTIAHAAPVCGPAVENENAMTTVHRQSSRGAKVTALMSLLRRVLAADPEEKIVVFAQWPETIAAVADAISDAVANADDADRERDAVGLGLGALTLLGGASSRAEAVERFQSEAPGTPRVLCLSYAHHAAGLNLHRANHVVIAHPYAANTLSPRAADWSPLADAAAYERQAVGRVLRYPQRRTCRVYRMFALGTVEEELYAAWGWI